MSTSPVYDVIVIGGGAGGMTAAAVAAAEGLSVLLVEKSARLGGSTAISGGMVWVPGNQAAATVGHPDSVDAARTYLANTVSGGHNAAVREAFLTQAAIAVAYLEHHTSVHLRPVQTYPDYYPDLPGATLGGRALEPVPFDARTLGRHFALVRPPLPEFTLFGGMMVPRAELPHFRNVGRSLRSALRVTGLVAAYAWQRLSHARGTSLVLGNALVARLLDTLLRQQVTLRLNASVGGLVHDSGAVRGVVLDGQTLHAKRAVILATGGFSHDPQLRSRLLPPAAGLVSAACPDNTGDGLRLGVQVGGHLETAGEGGAFWAPISHFTRPDGSAGVFPHIVTDRAKPGVIAVNRTAQRFVNEAVSYHEFVRAMLRADNTGQGTPHEAQVWLICDRPFLWRYGLGAVHPMCVALGRWRRSGYLLEAATVADLARKLGLDAAALTQTLAHYNEPARRGDDPQFGRGGNAYQRYMGDPEHKPNPCVAPIETPPFYAVALYPGDLGTSSGLATDATARVLGVDGQPIPGLYACGNDMNSVMNGAYPGPGITLGPALTFGYLAAQAIAAGG
jgi:succinate dehydrogenase/fumarate reductase flavoprotein subunit